MRLLSTILSALSLLLLLVVCFFWFRSLSTYDGIVHYSETGMYKVALKRGSAQAEGEINGNVAGVVSRGGKLTYASIANPPKEPWSWKSFTHPRNKPEPGPAMLMAPTIAPGGFSVGSGKATVADGPLQWELPYWRVTLPYWFLAIAFAIAPWLWFSRYRLVAQREREGRCPDCGADLNGATDKCPHCGATLTA